MSLFSRHFLRGPLLRPALILALIPLALFLILALILVRGLDTPATISNTATPTSDSDHALEGRLSLLQHPEKDDEASDLASRVTELLRIKRSVQKELRSLEKSLGERRRQETALTVLLEELKGDANRRQAEMDRMQVSMAQAKRALKEHTLRNTPEIRAPLARPASVPSSALQWSPPLQDTSTSCISMPSCWEYAHCGLTSNFGVFVYESEELEDDFLETFSERDPDKACLLMYYNMKGSLSPETDLESWEGTGRNHMLIDLSPKRDLSERLPADSKAVIMSSSFSYSAFRRGYDLICPFVPTEADSRIPAWERTPNILPVRKKYLASFLGVKDVPSKADIAVLDALHRITADQTDDVTMVNNDCLVDDSVPYSASEWRLCANRTEALLQSTFSVFILPAEEPEYVSSEALQIRLAESLRLGAIPVLIGGVHGFDCLPFSEQIDWRQAVISEPVARLPELHFLLRSLTDGDLFSMQRQGRLIWRSYFSTRTLVFQTAVGIIRERLHLPPPVTEDSLSPSVFPEDSPRQMLEQLPSDLEPSEPLGPLEQPTASPTFRRNFSQLFLDSHSRWNDRFDPLLMTPTAPWATQLPTDAKFIGSSVGFRPIGDGEGGSGREFSQALGGNLPSEQFTVVMLTYEREQVLIDSLIRLFGLPYLNKVVVVWNSPDAPAADLRWPDLGVPIEVVRTERNSLNNRFLPFDSIETEAVLSVDDDAHLRHDEIIFGFRVWREHRDRLVGFPGRFHAWDMDQGNSWNYNSNYSCELSMVLTGAAFYHKYYNYAYSQWMPTAIRDKVDEYMNCEDLAMNFLISHLTRKPPVKVTSRWTFRCPGCPVSLSEDDSHFQERHKCMNFFSRVFGYMPLLYTQFRADSVLFKTRIPADKQKCFKFI